MPAQRVHSVFLLLALGLASCTAHGVPLRPGRSVPSRCREASVTPVSCANTHFLDNLLPHPDDCELFYYCVTPSSQPICRQCPAHLHFNPRLRVCDQPSRASCQASSPTDGPTEETTTADVTVTEAITEASTETTDAAVYTTVAV